MRDAAVMVKVDPEAFGLDEHHAPRLGCATTGHLIGELQARMDTDTTMHPIKKADARQHLSHLRSLLTGEQLAYRTIDN